MLNFAALRQLKNSVKLPALRLAITAMAALSLTGCQRGADVKVSGSEGQPTFSLSKSGITVGENPCFYSISILTEGAERTDLFWSVSSRNEKCIELQRVNYGVTPAGFQTVVAGKPLNNHQTYTFVAHGAGWLGQIRFKLKDGSYVLVDQPES